MSGRILQGPKYKYPIENESLGHFFFNRCTKYSNRICQIDGTDDKFETFASVKQRSIRTAIELQKRNIKPNDVITVCSLNTLDSAIPIIAGFYIGAKITNVDPTFSVRHTRHLISLVTPKIIFVQQSSVQLIEDVLKDAEFKAEIVVFGDSEKYSTFSEFTKPQEDEENFAPVDVDLDETAVMFFSSGTTGLPKAICHTHRSIFLVIISLCELGWGQGDIHFTTFYSVTAWIMFGACFYFGNYRVFCRTYDGEEILKIFEKYEVKCVFMAPILTYELTRCKNAKSYNISSVKMMSVGGTPIAATQVQALENLFENAEIRNFYGMTEIGVLTGFDLERDKELGRKKIGSTGKSSPGFQIKVVDTETRELLGPNQKGEICALAPSLMKGYYKRDSSNEFDKDGFLKTGDIGYYDEDDCLYVVERIKEMFKYKSRHIIPAALEEVLLEHPYIKEVVVFGVPHEEDGELPAACILLKDGCSVTEKEIDEFLVGRVADRERLRGGVIFVDTIPKTPSGKLARKQVKEFALSLRTNSEAKVDQKSI